jgi:methylenetetrahydrofolate dehydrogenase (NADP+)/methenyltetrahydrofolate cyclohydrolase
LLGAPVATALIDAARAQFMPFLASTPTLAIVRLGERPDDLAYERGIAKRAEAAGVAVAHHVLPLDATQGEVLATIEALNQDPQVAGVLLMRPLPAHLHEAAITAAIAPEKDVDGATSTSLYRVFAGAAAPSLLFSAGAEAPAAPAAPVAPAAPASLEALAAAPAGFAPATAAACIDLLDHYGIALEGARVVVVGRSLVIGKPIAALALARNATVTVCHSRTPNLAAVCREATILIAAAGQRGLITAAHVAPGATVLDVGMHVHPATGKLCGDVDFDAVAPVAAHITPVPRGVGGITSAEVIAHTLEAAARAAALNRAQ